MRQADGLFQLPSVAFPPARYWRQRKPGYYRWAWGPISLYPSTYNFDPTVHKPIHCTYTLPFPCHPITWFFFSDARTRFFRRRRWYLAKRRLPPHPSKPGTIARRFQSHALSRPTSQFTKGILQSGLGQQQPRGKRWTRISEGLCGINGTHQATQEPYRHFAIRGQGRGRRRGRWGWKFGISPPVSP